MNYKLVCIGFLMGFGGVSNAQSLGGSFTWADNGHTYESWSTANGISYQDALAFASTRGGTLATITSENEKNAVLSNLGGILPSSSYLGAQQPSSEANPSANWTWATGEAWSYTNWSSGEPNDFNGATSEQNLEMYTDGTWNDIGDNTGGFNSGFLVEVVPEPSSAVALLALGGMLLARRRRAK